MDKQILDLVVAHKWVALAALVIGALVRLLRDDNRFPLTLPPKWKAAKPWIAIGLGLLAGVLDGVAGGATWTESIVSGIVAGLLPIVGHQVGIEWLRDGKELFAPSGGKPPTVPPLPLLTLGLVCLSLGCAGTFEEARLAGIQRGKVLAAAPDVQRCRELDDARIRAGAMAKGAAVVAGVSGAGAGVVGVVDGEPVPRAVIIGAGGVAVAAGAVAAYELVAAEGYGAAWVRECTP